MTIDRVIEENRELIQRWAWNIQKQSGADCSEDLIQEGLLALVEVMPAYDESRGAQPMTYAAPAVRNAMKAYAARERTAVTIPDTKLVELRKVAWLRRTEGEGQSAEEQVCLVMEKLNCSKVRAKKLLAQSDALLSSVSLDEHEYRVFQPVLPERVFEGSLLTAHLHELVDRVLTAKERRIVLRYFGLDGQEPNTLEELAYLLNYNSSSGVSRALQKALRKLRDQFQSGEYGTWINAKRELDQAKRELAEHPG